MVNWRIERPGGTVTSVSEIAHWITSIRQLLQPRPGMPAALSEQYRELRASITRTLTVDDVPVRYIPAAAVEKLGLDAVAWRRMFSCHEQNGRHVYVVRGEIPATVLENLLIELAHPMGPTDAHPSSPL